MNLFPKNKNVGSYNFNILDINYINLNLVYEYIKSLNIGPLVKFVNLSNKLVKVDLFI